MNPIHRNTLKENNYLDMKVHNIYVEAPLCLFHGSQRYLLKQLAQLLKIFLGSIFVLVPF